MHLLRWTAAVIAVAVSTIIILGNVLGTLRYWTTKRRSSQVPLVGGVAGALGLIVAPWGLAKWAWLPMAIDFGTIPLLAFAIFKLVSKKSSRER